MDTSPEASKGSWVRMKKGDTTLYFLMVGSGVVYLGRVGVNTLNIYKLFIDLLEDYFKKCLALCKYIMRHRKKNSINISIFIYWVFLETKILYNSLSVRDAMGEKFFIKLLQLKFLSFSLCQFVYSMIFIALRYLWMLTSLLKAKLFYN